MGYEWTVGELAVCVDDRPNDEDGKKVLNKGHIYPVAFVVNPGDPVVCRGQRGPAGNTGLGLSGFDQSFWWDARRFRPLNEDDEKCIREKHGNLVRDNIGLGSWK